MPPRRPLSFSRLGERGYLQITLIHLRRLLAVLGLVLRRELGLVLGMANEALRVGPIVLFAPISVFLKLGRQLRVALAALPLRHAVLRTPPAGVQVASFAGDVHGSGFARRGFVLICGWPAAKGYERNARGEQDETTKNF
jgi:hypothetical protein